MSSALTPQQVTPSPAPQPGTHQLELNEIQGDVLLGLQKLFERFVFFTIADVEWFKAALRDRLAPRITTTHLVQAREFQLRDHKTQGGRDPLPLVGLNVGFSHTGLGRLVPGADLGDPAFAAGARARAADPGTIQNPDGPPNLPINDPVDGQGRLTTWMEPFLGDIDGVFLVTGGTQAAVDAEANDVLGILGASVAVAFDQTGQARPGPEHGHEHFGWLDGVSQPAVRGLSDPFPGQDVLEPGLFVLGYPQAPGGPVVAPALPWMRNGSFMAFRRLKQLVPEFGQFLLDAGRSLGLDPVLLGARVVGRWKSGAPLALTPTQDDTALGSDPHQNNDFDFGDDPDQRRCPFAAHIRKTNPRQDLADPAASVAPRRIMRAGIPFGPEVTGAEAAAGASQEERGLMFVCYQASIRAQFEFVQGTWANNADFVFGKTRPNQPAGGPGAITVGIDPLIGQAAPRAVARLTDEPVPNYPTGNVRSQLPIPQAFVVPTGGGYFFLPSISALTHELSAPASPAAAH